LKGDATELGFVPDSGCVDAVVPAANVEPRRGFDRPDMLLLHYTGMASAARAIEWLASPDSRVSCHYVVDENGRITQMVPEALRAWHAGVSRWQGETDINSASVGIEIHNPGHEDGYWDFSEAQMAAVTRLSLDIVTRNAIAPQRVLAHSDVAPQRKIDPGEKFPWQRLHAAGVGHWVAPSPVRDGTVSLGRGDAGAAVAAVQRLLAGYGYDCTVDGMFDETMERVVRAFQRHFRPARCDGRVDLSTLATLERLIGDAPPVARATRA
jgi:N-acetylmuramoyl-L-alanine amidase